MSDRAKLAGFLSIWLKKCVILTLDVVAEGVILLAVCIAYRVHLALVPAVIANIQSGLR